MATRPAHERGGQTRDVTTTSTMPGREFNDQTGDYVPPRHSLSTVTHLPQWFDPAPRSYKYPWTNLSLPLTKNADVSSVFNIPVCV